MRALVTGGAGFIGSHVVDRLIERGCEVAAVDDLSTGKAANVNPRARLADMDIRDPALLDLADSFRPDVISHCAAQASVPNSVSDPMRDAMVNVVGGINVCRAAEQAGCSQLIYVTTGGALYGDPERLPCGEEHPIRPVSPYGVSKWTLEQYLRVLMPASMGVKTLRLANVYGPRQDPNGEAGVVAIFAARMLRGEPVTIFGDGEQTRDFVYVDDVVDAHERAMNSGESMTVNVGAGIGTSVNRVFETMARETGYEMAPKRAGERPGDVRHIYLDTSRARRMMGWQASTTLADGLRKTCRAFR